MLLLGHTGIILGSAIVVDAVLNRKQFQKESLPLTHPVKEHLDTRLKSLARHIDIRVLLIGSLLPDIIDKPLGQVIFHNTISSGRIFCHTVLFLLLIIIPGTYLYIKCKRNLLLVLSFGTFTHLIFDKMWLAPDTLFWPLYGWSFPRGDSNIVLFFKNMLIELISSPGTYISEITGAIVLLVFTWRLIKLKSLNNFIRKGCV